MGQKIEIQGVDVSLQTKRLADGKTWVAAVPFFGDAIIGKGPTRSAAIAKVASHFQQIAGLAGDMASTLNNTCGLFGGEDEK